MKKLIYLIIIIALFGIIVSGCLPVVPPAEQGELGTLPTKSPDILNVPDDHPTIQVAINAANPGDTIIVAAGLYVEVFTINKGITLQGEDKSSTIIDVGGGWRGIKITASDVTMAGFTMQNSKYFLLQTDTSNTQYNVVLRDNIFSKGRVQLYSIDNLEFSYNQISGFSVWRSSGTVTGNTMDDVNMGIGVMFCDNLTIQNNTITARAGENTDDGIFIMGGSNNAVEVNTITGFTAGPKTGYNNGVDGAGISIYVSTNCTVSENNLINNTLGVLVEKAGEGSEIHINDNNLESNTEFGVLNCGIWTGEDETYTPASVIIDATRNHWGSPTGPCRQLPNGKLVGEGDKVSSNVDYVPWLPHPM